MAIIIKNTLQPSGAPDRERKRKGAETNMNQCDRNHLHEALDRAIESRLHGTDGATGFIEETVNGCPFAIAFSVGNTFVAAAIRTFPSGGGGTEFRAGEHIIADIQRRAGTRPAGG